MQMVRYTMQGVRGLHSMLQGHTCLRWTLRGGGGCHAISWLLPLAAADFSLQCCPLAGLLIRAVRLAACVEAIITSVRAGIIVEEL